MKKMEFFRTGGSDKHLRDIAGVVKTSGSEIDRIYIGRWATTFMALHELGSTRYSQALAASAQRRWASGSAATLSPTRAS